MKSEGASRRHRRKTIWVAVVVVVAIIIAMILPQ